MRLKVNGLIWIHHHKGVSHNQIPVELKMLIYTMFPVAVTEPIYNYCFQICYAVLPMHWATQQISPVNVLVQNGYLLPHIVVLYPLILTKFTFWHMICTMLFVIATPIAFSKQTVQLSSQSVPLGMAISSVNHFWVRF